MGRGRQAGGLGQGGRRIILEPAIVEAATAFALGLRIQARARFVGLPLGRGRDGCRSQVRQRRIRRGGNQRRRNGITIGLVQAGRNDAHGRTQRAGAVQAHAIAVEGNVPCAVLGGHFGAGFEVEVHPLVVVGIELHLTHLLAPGGRAVHPAELRIARFRAGRAAVVTRHLQRVHRRGHGTGRAVAGLVGGDEEYAIRRVQFVIGGAAQTIFEGSRIDGIGAAEGAARGVCKIDARRRLLPFARNLRAGFPLQQVGPVDQASTLARVHATLPGTADTTVGEQLRRATPGRRRQFHVPRRARAARHLGGSLEVIADRLAGRRHGHLPGGLLRELVAGSGGTGGARRIRTAGGAGGTGRAAAVAGAGTAGIGGGCGILTATAAGGQQHRQCTCRQNQFARLFDRFVQDVTSKGNGGHPPPPCPNGTAAQTAPRSLKED